MATALDAALLDPLLTGSPTDVGLAVTPDDIFCQNVLAHANLNTTFELSQIVKGFRNAEYDPSKFPCVRIRYWRPQCTIAVFRSGKIQATGASSPEDARLAMHRTAARLKARMSCERVKFSDFTCDNILATYDLGSTMNLLGLSRAPVFANVVAYEPSRYPAVVLRDPARGVTVDVFSTGRCAERDAPPHPRVPLRIIDVVLSRVNSVYPFCVPVSAGCDDIVSFVTAADMAASGAVLRSTMKRLLRPFYLTVHPDITSTNMPREAATVNAKALQEVNAYVEALAATQSYPVVARTVTFFKPRVKGGGLARSSTGSSGGLRPVVQCNFELSSIPPDADFPTREGLAARLIRDIEAALIAEGPSMFSAKPRKGREIETLMKSGSIQPAARSSRRVPVGVPTSKADDPWKKLWDDETQERMFKMSLYDAETEEERRSRVYREELFNRYLYRVARKAVKTKGEKRKMDRLMDAERVAMQMVDEKLRKQESEQQKIQQEVGASSNSTEADDEEETPTEFVQRKARVIEGGYHPDLVFYSPKLTDPVKRQEGISRICGLELENDGDMWLLENIWRAVRAPPTPLPVVIGTKFEAVHDKGYFEIPYNFELKELVDFLEEHMDALKGSRAKLIEDLYIV